MSIDGQRLGWTDRGMITILGVERGENLGTLRGDFNDSFTSLSFGLDDRVAAVSLDGSVKVWDGLHALRETMRYATKVDRVLFSADGKRLAVLLASGPDANKPPVLHWYEGTTLREILGMTDLPNQVSAIALDKPGRRMAVATATDVRIFGAKTSSP
jgi:WD40 repeat protein